MQESLKHRNEVQSDSHPGYSGTDAVGALADLEAAAAEADTKGFSERLTGISWDDMSKDDFVQVIRLALKAGAHIEARRISERALQHYPNDDEVKKYARVLSPPRIISSSLPPDLGVEANRTWLSDHSGKFSGQWVALRAGELLGVARSMKELAALIGDTKGVLLTVAR